LKFVFKADPIARFRCHDKPSSRQLNPHLAYLQCKELKKKLIQRAHKNGGIIEDFLYFYRSYQVVLHKLNKTRGRHPRRFWWINPKAWLLRFLTRQKNAKLKALSSLLGY
jgi:hypothetical protein